jgi:hypothetical protein
MNAPTSSLTARAALLVALGAAGYQAMPGEDPIDPSGPALAVEDCGMACDGVTEDTATLTSCLLRRRHVILPAARTCVVRPTHASQYLAVHMPSGSTLEGSGASSVLRVLPTVVSGQERMARGVGATGPVRGVTIRDLAIDVDTRRMPNEQAHAVFFSGGGQDLRVHDITVIRAPGGDGVYLGADVAYASVRDIMVWDAGRNAVTVEGNSSALRPGIRISGVTRGYTPESDPTQRGGRLVDAETAGPGLLGLVVVGNTGPGGIEVGNADRAVVVGNVADRYHAVNATRSVVVGNSFRALTSAASFQTQRAASGLAVGNWVERASAGNAVAMERPEGFGMPVADYLMSGNRILYGEMNVKPSAEQAQRTGNRETLGNPAAPGATTTVTAE